jgi:hypothetical protein
VQQGEGTAFAIDSSELYKHGWTNALLAKKGGTNGELLVPGGQ